MKNCVILFSLFIIIPTFNVSCWNKSSSEKTLEEKIHKKLYSWNYNSDISIDKNKEILGIEIKFEGHGENSFFLDKESNMVIVSMLGYSFFNELKKFEEIDFKLSFENYSEFYEITLTEDKLELDKKNFDRVPLFYDFVEKALTDLRYIDVLKLTQIIDHLNKEFQDIFRSEEGFWNLLYGYSQFCQEPEKYVKEFYHFIFVGQFAKDMNMTKNSGIDLGSYEYYLDKCHIDRELLNKNVYELMEYIKENYPNATFN